MMRVRSTSRTNTCHFFFISENILTEKNTKLFLV